MVVQGNGLHNTGKFQADNTVMTPNLYITNVRSNNGTASESSKTPATASPSQNIIAFASAVVIGTGPAGLKS